MSLVGEGKAKTEFGVFVGVGGVDKVVGVVELGHDGGAVELGQEDSGSGGGRWVGCDCGLRDDFLLKRPLRSLRSLSMLSLCLRGEKVGVGGGGVGRETGTASLNLGGQSA